jgi:hypothetical protein
MAIWGHARDDVLETPQWRQPEIPPTREDEDRAAPTVQLGDVNANYLPQSRPIDRDGTPEPLRTAGRNYQPNLIRRARGSAFNVLVS